MIIGGIATISLINNFSTLQEKKIFFAKVLLIQKN